MKNILKNITDYLVNTKLGHFLFVFIITIILLLIINIFIDVIFIGGLIGGGICALYFALTDNNKRYW